MSIDVIHEWAKTDEAFRTKLNDILHLIQFSGCLALKEIPVISDRVSITKKLDTLFQKGERAAWFKEDIEKISAYIEIENIEPKATVVFLKWEEADVVIIYENCSGYDLSPHHIVNNGYIIVAVEPLLILSMYGAILGVCKTSKGYDIVTLDEGDDGWGDLAPVDGED